MRKPRTESGGGGLEKIKNSQLLNIIILLSFVGSHSHHSKVSRVDIWFYRFFRVRGGVIWGEVSAIEIDTSWNILISCKTLKSTHTYLILIFYYHFLVYFIRIQGPQTWYRIILRFLKEYMKFVREKVFIIEAYSLE